MKATRFNLYRLAFLSLAFLFLVAGCATVSYTPTQENIPRISYAEARQKLDVLKGNRIFVKNRYLNITDVKVGFDSMDVIYKKQTIFNIETGELDKETFYFKSLAVPAVVKEPNNIYYLRFPDRRMILFRNENDAITCANALFILKRRAEGYRPPVDAAAEAAFQEEARKYREMKVKPELPEEAHKFAVQGDFALEKKNLPAAADRYADALKVAPWWPEGHFKRGLVLADLEQYDEAIGEMKKYLLLTPNGTDARAAQDNIYKWESAGSLTISSQTSQSGTSTANPASGEEFKQAEIPVGKAVVYIYRPAGYGKGGLAMPFGVMVNGKDITTLVEGGYYAYICDPGQIEFVVHEIGFMAPKDTSSVSVNAQAGQAYYLKGSHGKGAIGRGHLESVAPATGVSEITGCKQITAQ
jgi:tetratricopeptide (TPR) repeat protein